MTPQPSEQPLSISDLVTRMIRNLGPEREEGAAARLADIIIREVRVAAPDPVADPTMLCGKCQHPMHWRECGADADLTAPCQCRNDVAIADPVATRAHAVFGQPGDDQRVVDEVTEARKAAVLLEGLRPFLLHRVTVAIVDGLAEYARLEGQPVAEEPP